MLKRFRGVVAACLLVFALPGLAADSHAPLSADQARALLKSLTFRTGQVHVGHAHASLDLTPGFSYLDGADARKVLEKLWDNPPDPDVLGMLVSGTDAHALFDKHGYVVVLTYSDDGHVADSDASSIDFDALLKKMQKQTRDANADRVKHGYAPVQLLGWAERPHYDPQRHELYWAKEAAFKGAPTHTLNYNIRALSREGYLSLDAVAGIDDLASVRSGMKQVLPMVHFDKGARYTDFDSHTDRVAAYGIAALIAGTLAAKAGLFAKLVAVLIAAKKLIIAGLAAVAAAARKLFKRKKA